MMMWQADRKWMHCIDAPTHRATSRIDHQLHKLKEKTIQRLAIMEKRWDRLQDVCHPLYDTDEEDTPHSKRLFALCERVQRHHEELEWRVKEINKAMTIMEEIGEFVNEVAHKPGRQKRLKAAGHHKQ